MPRDLTIPGQRHPEKAHRPETARQPKPEWIRVKTSTSAGYRATRARVILPMVKGMRK
ncbi:lipoic acid synthetase [Paracoccus isoporae]|uniref:Lipoic acid synthetase n=1 Tax=Paracoccus isoporae TaxID=591205 RepID=A0A1G7H361_9RHOB|nr:lipoic acid synthetase [Paracoccus isoporae]